MQTPYGGSHPPRDTARHKAKLKTCVVDKNCDMAERGGFEPPVPALGQYRGLANRCFQPLSHLSATRYHIQVYKLGSIWFGSGLRSFAWREGSAMQWLAKRAPKGCRPWGRTTTNRCFQPLSHLSIVTFFQRALRQDCGQTVEAC